MALLKLIGNFEIGYKLGEAYENVETANAEKGKTEYGSQEYYDALKKLKLAQAAHAEILRMLRTKQISNKGDQS